MSNDPDSYRILPIGRDRDALVGIGLSLVLVVGILATLAFLPDPAWERLVDRSKALYAVGASLIPALLVLSRRYKLRGDIVCAKAQSEFAVNAVNAEVKTDA